MSHTEQDLHERRTIEDMLNAKISVRKITAEIGRHVSTIYRDIKRNGYTDDELPELNGCYGVVAQRTARQRRARRRKLVRLAVLFRNNDRSSPHLMNRLMDILEPLPQLARKLKPGIGREAWFCDPSAPWQKGSVENLDKRAPRWLPRDTALSDHDMKAICDRLSGT